MEKYFVELLSDRYAAKDIRTYDLVNFFFSKMIDVKEKITLEYKRLCRKTLSKDNCNSYTKYGDGQWHYCLLDILSLKRKLQSVPLSLYIIRDEIFNQPYRALLERYQLGISFGNKFC